MSELKIIVAMGMDLAGTDGAVPGAITVVKAAPAVQGSRDCFLN
jgi:hypothetical protein